MAGLWCSSLARARSCGVPRREAHGHLKHKPPHRRGGMWLGMWDVLRGTGSVSSCSIIVLTITRRLPWPNRAGSTRNVHDNSIQPFARTRTPTPVERCQPVRSHDIGAIPMPWGATPKQGALRGVVTSFGLAGRCSYAASHKCHLALGGVALVVAVHCC